MSFERYGLTFTETDSQTWTDVEVERYMIQQGGRWTNKSGEQRGEGLEFHFKRYWQLLWPDDSQTRWTDLILHEVLNNQFTAIAGGASSWKTGTVARIALMDWSCFHDCTTIIVSSTDMDSLRARIFGEIGQLWSKAHEAFEWWPGEYLDYKCVIANQKVDPESARDMRDAIVGVPCRTSTGRFLGLSKYAGRKNWRVWSICDELQFSPLSFLDAQNNLISNGPNLLPGMNRDTESHEYLKPRRGYKCVFIGNPNPTQPDNPLHAVSEPEGGWGSINEEGGTKVWDCKQMSEFPIKARCVNLDALDSPNSDYPIDNPKWVNMCGPHTVRRYREGSDAYWSQGRGLFKFGLAEFKIITVDLCNQFHAFESLAWDGEKAPVKIGMCDAAYGGGDRCPVGWLEFGKCIDSKTRILLHPYKLVPIIVCKETPVEDQIVAFCRKFMDEVGVPPENFYYEGRATLASAFARKWDPLCNAIDFGGRPTDRVVGPDIYMYEPNGGRRLKLANEHYSKLVSELWFSSRYAVEADQVRGITLDIVQDGQPREWEKVKGDKIEIESKVDMKKRTGVSPDLYDMFVIGIEGARRRGFTIATLVANPDTDGPDYHWLHALAKQQERFRAARTISYR